LSDGRRAAQLGSHHALVRNVERGTQPQPQGIGHGWSPQFPSPRDKQGGGLAELSNDKAAIDVLIQRKKTINYFPPTEMTSESAQRNAFHGQPLI
jgi:hypothetical protein